MNLSKNQNKIIEISKKLGLSHIGSNMSCLPVLEEIYEKKKPRDIVGLSGGHAHLGHLVVKFQNQNNVPIDSYIKEFGIHCDRKCGCDISTGSLGHAVGIGLGLALADKTRDVYIIVTDGSLQEGSEWEALAIKKRLNVSNLKIYTNLNGFTAVDKINRVELSKRLITFCPDVEIRYTDNVLPELDGLEGHYKTL